MTGDPASKKDVTVLICTRNSARRLRRTLASVAKLDNPDGSLREVIVVDNGSTDGTQRVIEQALATNGLVRAAWEPIAGHNRAYNTGVAAAQGAYVLFTDDDVRPTADWAIAMRDRMLLGNLDALAGGVSVGPRYERLIRKAGLWSIRDWFAVTDVPPPGELGFTVGANMMFRRSTLQEAGQFRLDLGPGAVGDCGDTEYFQRIVRLGYRVGSAHDICVDHRFSLDRLRWPSLKATARRRANSGAYMSWHGYGNAINTPSLLELVTHDLPRVIGLPLAAIVWNGARARQLHQIRRWAAIRRSQIEQACGPPKWLGLSNPALNDAPKDEALSPK